MGSPSSNHEWLGSSQVSWWRAVFIAVVWTGCIFLIARTDVGAYFETKLARPLDFRVREALGLSATISPRLKVLSVDDRTYAKLGGWTWSLSTWAQLLKAIDATEPRAIVIDAMFSKTDTNSTEAASFLELLKDLKTPVITGAFVTPAAIQFRETLSDAQAHYNLRSFLNPHLSSGELYQDLPPLVDRRGWFAYGPDPVLGPVLKNVGHFIYQGDGQIAPLLRWQDDKVIPHLSLLVGNDRRIEQGRLLVDHQVVPMTSQGNVVVNFPSPTAWRNVNMSILPHVLRSQRGKPLEGLNKDDVVVILPLMWTGNADFKATPFGTLPAGFVISSMVNSVLTGEWLKPLVAGELLYALAAFIGAAMALLSGILSFWLALFGGALLLLGLSEYLFAFHGVVSPWLMSLTAFGGAALSVFAEKIRAGERKAQRLRHALEGSIAPDELQSLLKNPDQVNLEARERIVTLMFIDVVGFSLMAENMLPRIAFDNLKRLLALIGETVHQHGGIIDKTLGDGLLCYFGYRFDRDESTPDHAEKALRCALTIQQHNLNRNLEAARNSEPVYPLRIGINTSSCYLGDLGSGERIDFTVVGNGVNFAKRLEGACEMHSVLFGATTYDLVKGMGLPEAAVSKRFIRIKHHSELVESYEYDPFYLENERRLAAVDAFRRCANIQRFDRRWPVHDPSRFALSCDFGKGELVNFSRAGLSVRLKQPLVKDTRLTIMLDSPNGVLRPKLSADGIDELRGEVRWVYNDGGEFVHGVMLAGLTESQGEVLVQYLCEFAFARMQANPDGDLDLNTASSSDPDSDPDSGSDTVATKITPGGRRVS